MVKPRFTSLPKNKVFLKLRKRDELRHKALVTGVYSCPMFALIATTAMNAEAAFALTVQDQAGIAKAGVDAKWATKATSGNWETGGKMDGEDTYYPLFQLSTPAPDNIFDDIFHRGLPKAARPVLGSLPSTPTPAPDAAVFKPYPTPWGALDKDGHEVAGTPPVVKVRFGIRTHLENNPL